MARFPSSALAPATAFTACLLIASLAAAEPPKPAPVNVNKQTVYNGGSRYVSYQIPPDAPPRIQALYRSLGQAENDQFLSDQLQQLLLEYTEQERVLSSARSASELIYGLPGGLLGRGGGYTSPSGIIKAQTVIALTQAAQVRAQFGGEVNLQLLQLQEQERALKAQQVIGRSRTDVLQQEATALQQQRAAWQRYQAALQSEQATAGAVERLTMAPPPEIADGIAVITPPVTDRTNQAVNAHRMAQQSVQKAKADLDVATANLRNSQKESMLVMRVSNLVSNPAAPEVVHAPTPVPGVQPSASAEPNTVKATPGPGVQGNRDATQPKAAPTAQMAALASKMQSPQERAAWINEQYAAVTKELDWPQQPVATPAQPSAPVATQREAQQAAADAQDRRAQTLTALAKVFIGETPRQAAAHPAQSDRAVVTDVLPIASPVVAPALTVDPPPAPALLQPTADLADSYLSWMVIGLGGLLALWLLKEGLPTLLLHRRLTPFDHIMAADSPNARGVLHVRLADPQASKPTSDC